MKTRVVPKKAKKNSEDQPGFETLSSKFDKNTIKHPVPACEKLRSLEASSRRRARMNMMLDYSFATSRVSNTFQEGT